jgi:hypothetical protein
MEIITHFLLTLALLYVKFAYTLNILISFMGIPKLCENIVK